MEVVKTKLLRRLASESVSKSLLATMDRIIVVLHRLHGCTDLDVNMHKVFAGVRVVPACQKVWDLSLLRLPGPDGRTFVHSLQRNRV